MKTTTRRRALRVVLAIVPILIVSVIASLAWARSDAGHAWIARRLEETISSQIRGHLEIGTLDSADLHHVSAHDVRFFDESGRIVIAADEAELDYDLGALVHGRFVSPRGHAHGGHVFLQTAADGTLFLDRAFRSAHPGPPGAPIGDDVVHLENLMVDDVTLVAAVGSAPTATVREVGATVLVRAPENGAAAVGAQRLHGAVHVAAPIPFDLRIVSGTFDVDGAARRRAHVAMPSRMGSEHVDIEVTVTTTGHDVFHVDARIRPHGVSATLAAAGMISQALVAETQSDVLDVTVEQR
jgi:hypothetical protein